MDIAQRAAAAFQQQATAVQRNAAAVTQMLLTTAGENVAAALEFGQRVCRAKSPAEIARLQSEYIHGRVQAFVGRASQLSQEVRAVTHRKDSQSATNETLEDRYAQLAGTATATVGVVDAAAASGALLEDVLSVKPLPDPSAKGRQVRQNKPRRAG